LFCSANQLLSLYALVAPMILNNVINTVKAPPPSPTTTLDNDDSAAAGEVEDVLWPSNAAFPFIVTLLGLLSDAGFYLVTGSEVLTIVLLMVRYFLHRILQQLVEVSKSDVDLVVTLLWFLTLWEMKMWSVFCLERAIIRSARAVHTLIVSFCPADILSFPIVATIYRTVNWLLLPNGGRTQMVACVVYVVVIALPYCVADAVLGPTAGDIEHLLVAVRFSVLGSSPVIRSYFKRHYLVADVVSDVECVNDVVKVSKQITAAPGIDTSSGQNTIKEEENYTSLPIPFPFLLSFPSYPLQFPFLPSPPHLLSSRPLKYS